MFSPKPNVPYKFVFQEIKNNVPVESSMIIIFTEKNNIYPAESCFGFTPYECFDKHDFYRYVCYVCYMDDNSIVLNGKLNSFDITKIYLVNDNLTNDNLEDEIVYSI
jgi:hypothetical protein